LDYLREVGLTPNDIVVKISSRKLLALFLTRLGIPKDRLESIYAVLDKKTRLSTETFEKMLREQVPNKEKVSRILDFMSADTMPQLEELIKAESDEFEAYTEIKLVLAGLELMGVSDYCTYDPSIVRGLAYYTGIVFEVHAVGSELRAICGGGRFDNLLRDFGGPPETATGMGMGDCVLEILLRERGLLDKNIVKRQIDYFVALADNVFSKQLYEVTAKLRSKGFSASFSYKPLVGLSKQLKEAATRNAQKCIIIGDEFKNNELVVKDMTTGRQKTIEVDKFFTELKS
jgi:histidyl-tRNA synthetase